MRLSTPDIYVSEFGREDTPERIISLHETYRDEFDKTPTRRSLYVPTAETALLSNDNRGSYVALPINAGGGGVCRSTARRQAPACGIRLNIRLVIETHKKSFSGFVTLEKKTPE